MKLYTNKISTQYIAGGKPSSQLNKIAQTTPTGAPAPTPPAGGGGPKGGNLGQKREVALQSIIQEIDNTVKAKAQAGNIKLSELATLMKAIDSRFGTKIQDTVVQSIKPSVIQEVVKQLNANITQIANIKGKNSPQTTAHIISLASEIDNLFGTKLADSLKLKMPKGLAGAAAGAAPVAPPTGTAVPTGGAASPVDFSTMKLTGY